MSTSAPTVTQLKQRFLAAQILQLSTPLAPSAAFRAANAASENPLEARLLQAIVTAVDGAVQEHGRRIYPPQATRAVAEQISESYTSEAERKLRPYDDAEDGIGREVNLADSAAIDALPKTWASERDVNNHPMEARRYADTVNRLNELNEQRQELRARVERLRRIKATVDPLSAPEDGEGVTTIQENLVTRNGPVEKELEKMQMLLLRVTGRVGGLDQAPRPAGNDAPDGVAEPLATVRKRNIEEFLADPKVFPTSK